MIIGITGKLGAGKTTVALSLAERLKPIGYTIILKSMADPLKGIAKTCFGVTKNADDIVPSISPQTGTSLVVRKLLPFVDPPFMSVVKEKHMAEITQELCKTDIYKELVDLHGQLKGFAHANSPNSLNVYKATCKLYTRRLLQYIGTDIGRKYISSTVWSDMFEHSCKNILNSMCDGFDNPIIISDDVRFDEEIEAIQKLGDSLIVNVNAPLSDIAERLNMSTADLIVHINAHPSEKNSDTLYKDITILNENYKALNINPVLDKVKEMALL